MAGIALIKVNTGFSLCMTPEHLESDSFVWVTIKKLLSGHQICSQYITVSQESDDRIRKDEGVVV